MEKSERASKIDDLANLPTPVNKFKSKYKKPTIYALVLVLLSIAVVFTDYYLLPQKKTEDVIVRYQKITDRYYKLLGYKYSTQEGFDFYISGGFIEEFYVTIEHTSLFKNIKKVITAHQKYSYELLFWLSLLLLVYSIYAFIKTFQTTDFLILFYSIR